MDSPRTSTARTRTSVEPAHTPRSRNGLRNGAESYENIERTGNPSPTQCRGGACSIPRTVFERFWAVVMGRILSGVLTLHVPQDIITILSIVTTCRIVTCAEGGVQGACCRLSEVGRVSRKVWTHVTARRRRRARSRPFTLRRPGPCRG